MHLCRRDRTGKHAVAPALFYTAIHKPGIDNVTNIVTAFLAHIVRGQRLGDLRIEALLFLTEVKKILHDGGGGRQPSRSLAEEALSAGVL